MSKKEDKEMKNKEEMKEQETGQKAEAAEQMGEQDAGNEVEGKANAEENQLDKLSAQVEKEKDNYLRLFAEFENY